MLRAVCWAALILSTLSAALHLNANSFWLDEIFTAYVAEARRDTWPDLLRFLASDTNPPGYFILMNLLDRVFTGDIHLWSRGLSLLCATAALFVLYAAPSEEVNAEARLFGVAYASTTTIWYEFAPMARSYALVFLCAALMAFAFLRIRRAVAGGEAPYRWYGLFVAAAVIATLLNYYALLLAGGLIGALVLMLSGFRQRLVAAAFGGLILAAIAPVIAWQQNAERIAANQASWFQSDVAFILNHLWRGVAYHVDGYLTLVFWGGIGGVFFLEFIRRRVPVSALTSALSFIMPFVFAFVFVGLSGIMISVLVVPIFQVNTLLVAAPMVWLSMMAVMALALEHTSLRSRRLAMLSSIILLLLASGKMALRDQAFQSPYREIAEKVGMTPNCFGAPIPFLSDARAYDRYQAGFYLPNPTILAPRAALRADRLPAEVLELARERFADPQSCGVLLWDAHFPSNETMEKARALFARDLPPPVGRRLRIEIVVPSEPSELDSFLRPIIVRQGFVLLLE